MEVTLALLADYANVTREGKLNVMGIFTHINAPVLPCTHPQMQLVLELEASPAEWESQKNVEIKLLDEDANTIFTLSADMKIPRGQPGKRSSLNSILTFNNVRFDRAGDYVFAILVNGEPKKEVRLTVNYRSSSLPSGNA